MGMEAKVRDIQVRTVFAFSDVVMDTSAMSHTQLYISSLFCLHIRLILCESFW